MRHNSTKNNAMNHLMNNKPTRKIPQNNNMCTMNNLINNNMHIQMNNRNNPINNNSMRNNPNKNNRPIL